jgi:hypothetical protein
MTEESIAEKKISRRKFLGAAVGGAAALGVVAGASSFLPHVAGAAAPKSAKAVSLPNSVYAGNNAAPLPIPTTWDQSADVVVVGYGGAGGVTAITAFDAGADVLILEKTPSQTALGISSPTISGGGGNTHIDGGLVVWPTDPVLGATHLYYLSFGATPWPVCQAWGTMANQNKAWLDSMGVKCTLVPNSGEFPFLPGGSSISNYNVVGGGAVLFKALDVAVQSRNIPVLFDTAATDLFQDPTTGEILGVRATQNLSEVVTIQAKRAVVLTCGGLEYNDEMKVRYLKTYPAHFYGWQYNTGDGIKMAQKVGAGLWHMNAVSGRPEPWIPTYNEAWSYANPTNNYIWVDRYGNRYINESGYPSHSGWTQLADFNMYTAEYTRNPSFVIFDSLFFNAGPVAGGGITSVQTQLGGVLGGTAWNNAAMVAAGFIIQGSTIAELAANLAAATIPGSNAGTIPPGWNAVASVDTITLPAGYNADKMTAATLGNTVNTYNGYVAAGNGDPDFGRTQATMAPVSTPPFYALPLWLGGPNTQGGPIRNEMGQVCDPDDNPIPRLYSAGELGSIYGFLYPTGGGNNCELIAFGRIAGTNAAAEQPWTS